MASTSKDRRAIQRTMESIIASAQRNSSEVRQRGLNLDLDSSPAPRLPQLPDAVAALVYSVPARRRLCELVLSPDIVEKIEDFIQEFSEAALLRAHSLEPRHTVILVGPPGNGKTSLAEAFAAELSLPLLSLRYDAIVDSYLGETSTRLRKLIDYATQTPCVLFFDEFDAVGKERNDAQETGEIKRVVSTLLMQMDRMPSHTVIICATNHPEMLDRAIWRRFELQLDIERPNRAQLTQWFEQLKTSLGEAGASVSPIQLATFMEGQNMSAVEAFTLDVRRKMVLARGKLSAAEAVKIVMKRGKQRAHDLGGSSSGDGPSDSQASTNERR